MLPCRSSAKCGQRQICIQSEVKILRANRFEQSDAVSRLRLAAISVYVLSLLLPALITSDGNEPGVIVLIEGVFGPFMGLYGWFANPLLVISLSMMRKLPIPALLLAMLGLLLAIVSVNITTIPYDEGSATFIDFHVGYFVWLLSFPIAMLGALWRIFKAA